MSTQVDKASRRRDRAVTWRSTGPAAGRAKGQETGHGGTGGARDHGAERGKIADDLRRYGAYHERTGVDLWNVFTKQKPHELEPPNLTQEIKGRTASHHAVAESCMAMASVIESENPLLLTPETVQLIQEAFGDIYGGEFPLGPLARQ